MASLSTVDSPLSSPHASPSPASQPANNALTSSSVARSPGPVSPAKARSVVTDSKKRSQENADASASGPPPKKSSTAKAPDNPKPASTRPTRNRKAPERLAEIKEPPKQPVVPRKPTSKVFNPIYITTNSTSRLRKADVYHLLMEPAAWDLLAQDQQLELISMLPRSTSTTAVEDEIRTTTNASTRPRELTVSFDTFRTDVAKFGADLAAGHLAKGWQLAAENAVKDRAAGTFDPWKAKEAEDWWGQNSA